jgi:hypothetical protein
MLGLRGLRAARLNAVQHALAIFLLVEAAIVLAPQMVDRFAKSLFVWISPCLCNLKTRSASACRQPHGLGNAASTAISAFERL